MTSPRATNVLLVAILVVTIAAVLEFVRRTEGGGTVSAETTGVFLALLTVLFAVRVAGQLVAPRGAALAAADGSLEPDAVLAAAADPTRPARGDELDLPLPARRRRIPRRAAPWTRAPRRRLQLPLRGLDGGSLHGPNGSAAGRALVRRCDPDRLPRGARGLRSSRTGRTLPPAELEIAIVGAGASGLAAALRGSDWTRAGPARA